MPGRRRRTRRPRAKPRWKRAVTEQISALSSSTARTWNGSSGASPCTDHCRSRTATASTARACKPRIGGWGAPRCFSTGHAAGTIQSFPSRADRRHERTYCAAGRIVVAGSTRRVRGTGCVRLPLLCQPSLGRPCSAIEARAPSGEADGHSGIAGAFGDEVGHPWQVRDRNSCGSADVRVHSDHFGGTAVQALALDFLAGFLRHAPSPIFFSFAVNAAWSIVPLTELQWLQSSWRFST